jgi:hypothetical protein
MGVWDSYRVSRSIRILLSAQQVSTAARLQALPRLKQLSRRAVPKLVAALAMAEPSEPVAEVLASLLDNHTLALLCQGLTSANPRVVTGVVGVLSKSGVTTRTACWSC